MTDPWSADFDDLRVFSLAMQNKLELSVCLKQLSLLTVKLQKLFESHFVSVFIWNTMILFVPDDISLSRVCCKQMTGTRAATNGYFRGEKWCYLLLHLTSSLQYIRLWKVRRGQLPDCPPVVAGLTGTTAYELSIKVVISSEASMPYHTTSTQDRPETVLRPRQASIFMTLLHDH